MKTIFALFLLLAVSAVNAAPVAAPNAFGTFMTQVTGSGQQTIGFGSGGIPILSPGVPTIHTAGATPIATFTGTFPAASAGARVPITATAAIGSVALRSAFGRLVRSAVPVLSVGVALYDVAKELNYLVAGGGGQPLYFSESVEGGVTNTCYNSSVLGQCVTASAMCAADYPSSSHVSIVSNNYAECQGSVWSDYYGTWSPYFGSRPPVITQTVGVTIYPRTEDEFLDAVAAKSGWPSTSAISKALADSAIADPATKIQTERAVVTGPPASPSTTSISTKPSPTGGTDTETKVCQTQYVYALDVVNTKEACATTTLHPDGTVTQVGTTETPTVDPKTPKPDPITCGLPGTPACKIDETGTKPVVTDTEYSSRLDQYKTDQDSLRDKAKGNEDKSFFSSWTSVFVTPPLAECTPFELPSFAQSGTSMGSIDPCGVVNGVRTVMAYLWAVGGLWLCLGMIKKVV